MGLLHGHPLHWLIKILNKNSYWFFINYCNSIQFLDFKLNLPQGTTIEKKLEDTFRSFFNEKYFVTFRDQRTSADIVIKILVNLKEKEIPKDGMPFIQYISSDIKIINAKNDNELFEFAIPEIRGGDFDQRKKASKKAIKNLIKYIKTTDFLKK